jgi:acetylornithine deacetylase
MSTVTDAQMARTLEMIERLIAFDTTSRNSNMALIEDVRGYLADLGVACRLTHDESGTKANLWATIGPQDKGGVVLSGHTDVVPIDGQDWTKPAFALTEAEGKLYGRGTSDMKSFVAIALAMVPEMIAANLKVPIHFAFTYDEEVGCVGVHGLIDDILANLPKPRAVIVGEPTSMRLVGGHKGTRVYRTRITGVPGHSSDPSQGANAIFAASRMIGYMEEVNRELEAAADPASPFKPPHSLVSCGIIQGGTAHNIIPEICDITWGMRLLPGEDGDAIQARIEAFVAREVEPMLKAAAPHAGVVTTLEVDSMPLAPDTESPAEHLVKYLTGLNESLAVSFGTEAGAFQKAGMPAVVFGPGSIEQAHKADEFIERDQVRQCVGFIGDLIEWAKTTD